MNENIYAIIWYAVLGAYGVYNVFEFEKYGVSQKELLRVSGVFLLMYTGILFRIF